MTTILIILLILVLLGAIPGGRAWGYGPFGVVGLLIFILLILALTGRL